MTAGANVSTERVGVVRVAGDCLNVERIVVRLLAVRVIEAGDMICCPAAKNTKGRVLFCGTWLWWMRSPASSAIEASANRNAEVGRNISHCFYLPANQDQLNPGLPHVVHAANFQPAATYRNVIKFGDQLRRSGPNRYLMAR